MASSNASALNQLCVTIWLDESIQLGLPWQLLLLYCEKIYSLFKCLVSKWMLVSIWHMQLGFTLYLCAHDFSCLWAFVFWSLNYWFCLPYVYPVVVWWLRLSCTFWLCVWKFWETKKTRPSTELPIFAYLVIVSCFHLLQFPWPQKFLNIPSTVPEEVELLLWFLLWVATSGTLQVHVTSMKVGTDLAKQNRVAHQLVFWQLKAPFFVSHSRVLYQGELQND
jgi:hypothetical protein